MGKVKTFAYEAPRCLVCGKELEHKTTGRPRRFCSNACKQLDYREFRRWARATVEAELLGLPELPKTWRREERRQVLRNLLDRAICGEPEPSVTKLT